MDLSFLYPQIPPETSEAKYFICVALAVLITAIAKAGFGGGIGVLAVPLTAAALPTNRAMGILLPILIVADLFTNLHHIKTVSRKHAWWLCIGALLGVAVGTVILYFMTKSKHFDMWLNLLVGGSCLFFVGLQTYRMVGGKLPHLPQTPSAGYTVGFLAGGVSTLSHTAGPIVNIYLLEQRLEKSFMVGTAAVYFLAINCAKVPTFVWLEYITWESVRDSLWTMPLIPFGCWLGAWMHRRISDRPFTIIMYVGATVAAIWMIVKVVK